MNIHHEGTHRRTFLKGVGLATAGALVRPWAAAATDAADYLLSNGFVRLSGSYGKLTAAEFDPAGRGQYEPATFSGIYLGATDLFVAGFNDGVQWTNNGTELQVSGIRLPVADNLQQRQTNSPVPLGLGHTIGQSFTVTAAGFNRVGGSFPSWGSTNSTMTLTLYAGVPGGSLTKLTSRVVGPIQDNAWAYLDVPVQPAGQYYLEMSDASGTPGWWSQLGPASTDVGGSAFSDRQAQSDRTMTIDVTGFAVAGTASWRFTLHGPRLDMSYQVRWQGAPQADPGLTLDTSWVRDGYSIDYSDGVRFSRFFGSDGMYLPAQQLKRRDSWTNAVSAPQWIEATGTGPYDLRLTASQLALDGTMAASSMSLSLSSGGTAKRAVISRSLAAEVRAHTGELPEIFPVFLASDEARAAQLSEFYYERALSFGFDGTAVDWKDWEGRILDWTGTAGARGEARSLLDTTVGDDGYVWSWSDSPGWPFPDPTLYDSRHFTSNAMYMLGAWRYYSWSGDGAFLRTIMPRVRKAMNFYLDSLGGDSGILTITSPDHTGRDQSVSSNYWDVTAFGHLDAYLNAYFYGALEAVAQLEDHLENSQRANQLRALRETVQHRYNELFWDPAAGRYIQAIDVDGARHDFGSVYVNLEATSFGLPSAAQAERIFDWLENGYTELRDPVVLISSGGLAPKLAAGHTMGQSFTAADAFTTVAAWFATYGTRGAEFTMSLYQTGPGGVQLASAQFTDWGDGGVAHINLPEQPAGTYYLEVSQATGTLAWWSSPVAASGGTAYSDGVRATDAASRVVTALGPYHDGPADIYSRWGFTPRATTRRNDFWYIFSWTGVTTPWEKQLQDGGANLYISGFDVLARAGYRSADDAWGRLTAVLDRWSEPDHLCGGAPLYRGEDADSDGGGGGGAVGTDNPFPESGMVPASFLYAFVGVQAEPDALVITPNLPVALTSAGVRNLYWRDRRVQVLVTRDTVTVQGSGLSIRQHYRPGDSVRVRPPTAAAR